MIVMDVELPRRVHRLYSSKRGEEGLRRGCGIWKLAWRLQKDLRVVNLERRNIRYLSREEVQEETDLIVIDTSFISVEKFLPHLLGFLKRKVVILS